MRKPVSRVLTALVLSAWHFGCLAEVSIPFEGESMADESLQKDGLANAVLMTSINGCSNIERAVSSVISLPSGKPLSQEAIEEWTLYGCGKEYPFLVRLKGDGEGGAFVTVQRQF